MLRVCLPHPPAGEFLEILESAVGNAVTIGREDPEAEILVHGTPASLDEFPRLRAIVIPYAGVPKRTRELVATRPGITLHNLHHNAAPTAETAFALMLAAAKSVVPIDQALRRADWRPRYEKRLDLLLDGAKAVVLGFGAIGRTIGRMCEGLGMTVDGIRSADRDRFPACLSDARVLFVCAPWTPQTEGIVNAAALAQLPDQSVVVNVARGPLIDEGALYTELESGRLRAGLDVWWVYPKSEEARADCPPAERDFASLDTVVMSPHRAGHCDGIERLRAEHLARLLQAAVNGDAIPNRVDLERGY